VRFAIGATIPAHPLCALEVQAMSTLVQAESPGASTQTSAARIGHWTAILLALLAIAAFALGVTTPPRSGPFCTGTCIAYPYTDAIQFVPSDYFWVMPSILLTPLFVVLVSCIHECVERGKQTLSLIALCFASISAGIITLDYFIQFEVIEPSLLRGETSGLSLFTQYNPHGLFIALEDLGYLMLSGAFFFAGTAFGGANHLERAVRWTLISSALLAFASFVGMTWHFGLDLEYRFEVTIITITWTTLVVLGVMLSFFFRRANHPVPIGL